MNKKVLVVVGTRPNFIKVTQLKKYAKLYSNIDLRIVHTGQHYDSKMADIFFEQFNLIPDYFLDISSASANTQMAEIMLGLEKIIKTQFNADILVVVGDVNSTLAGAITANKLGVKLAHIESGLRSNDFTMPEEINRILTDKISDLFFVTEKSGYDNLINEGKQKEQIFFVGNTMIDTLVGFDKEIDLSDVLSKHNLEKDKFVLMTMHRPATVDSKEGLINLFQLMDIVTNNYKLLFPIHPRTLKNIEQFNLLDRLNGINNLILTEPLDYFSFQKLIKYCKFILTDSGGIQEESTFRKVPCLTLRANTERPVTCDIGTNTLVPFDIKVIKKMISDIENNKYKNGNIPDFWDGKSSERIVKILSDL